MDIHLAGSIIFHHLPHPLIFKKFFNSFNEENHTSSTQAKWALLYKKASSPRVKIFPWAKIGLLPFFPPHCTFQVSCPHTYFKCPPIVFLYVYTSNNPQYCASGLNPGPSVLMYMIFTTELPMSNIYCCWLPMMDLQWCATENINSHSFPNSHLFSFLIRLLSIVSNSYMGSCNLGLMTTTKNWYCYDNKVVSHKIILKDFHDYIINLHHQSIIYTKCSNAAQNNVSLKKTKQRGRTSWPYPSG